jgi:hypothetical protein
MNELSHHRPETLELLQRAALEAMSYRDQVAKHTYRLIAGDLQAAVQ